MSDGDFIMFWTVTSFLIGVIVAIIGIILSKIDKE